MASDVFYVNFRINYNVKLLVMPPKRKRKAEPVSINKDKPATKKRRKSTERQGRNALQK